ncbi:MAG: ABC transporter ATP-binding protein [Flavobacteriales bacterium]
MRPNGAGKSTTIRCLLSLIHPTSGDIKLFGKSLSTHREAILRQIGCIIEKPDFYKYLSAEKNLEIFARISGASTAKYDIHAMLEFVGLKGRERDKVSGFSHGMKQRLGIAQTLIHDPELIILDEPTTGLDPQGIIDVRNLILQLKNEKNKTVLLSSHQLSEIEIIANRMVIINKGQTVTEGEVSKLLNEQELVVRMEVQDSGKALRILNGWSDKVKENKDDNTLEFATSREALPSIIKSLTENDVLIYGVESKRKLEDYFIRIIN